MQTEELTLHLGTLKEHLIKNPEFIETLKYFHDHLAEKEWFLSKKVSHRSKAEKLRIIVQKAVESFAKKERIKIFDDVFLRVRDTPFYHGAFKAEHYFCSVIYFDDIGMGIVALIRPGDPLTHTIRITAQMLGTGPVWN
jgi:hypothetical protein